MTFEKLIEAFAKYVNAEVEIVDNTVSLEVDEMPVIIMNSLELDSIILSGEIAEPPPQGLELLYKTALQANCNFKSTLGATLSLDEQTGNFFLCKLVSA